MQIIPSSLVVQSEMFPSSQCQLSVFVHLDSGGSIGAVSDTVGSAIGTANCVVSTEAIGMLLANTIEVWQLVIVVYKLLILA